MGYVRIQVTARSGHTVCTGHMGGLGTKIDVTDSDPVHGGFFHTTYMTCMVLGHTPYVCMSILVSKESLGL